jgi:hypothetical protein
VSEPSPNFDGPGDDDDDEEEEEEDPESEDEPIGDPPLSGFADDRATRGNEHEWAGDVESSYEPAWPRGPRGLPTFDPEHPPLPRVPLVGSHVDEQLKGLGVRGFGNGRGYDERPPLPGAPQVSLGGPLPMWPDQGDFDMTTQIIVKRREPDGSLAHLGTFPKDASINMVLAKYPNPGIYYVFPVDAMGREFDRHNPTRIDIPADHEFFQQKKKLDAINAGPGAQALAAMGMGGQVVAPEFLALVNKLFDQQRAEADAAKEEARRDREAIEKERMRLAERDQALAVREIEHVTTASKDLLSAANSQFAGILAMMQTMNSAQAQHAEAAAERERLRLEASHKAAMEQSQQTSKMMFEQFTAVTKIHTDVSERDRQRDKDALEAEKVRLAEMGKMQTTFMNAEEKRRQAVFTETQNAEKRSGLAGLTDTLETYKKLKELMGGTEPEAGEGGSAWWEKAAEMFQEAQRMKHEMRIEKMRMRAGYPGGIPLPAGFEDDDGDEDSDMDGMMPPAALRGPVQGGMQIPASPYAVGGQAAQTLTAPLPFAGLGTPMGELRQAVPPPLHGLEGQRMNPPAVQPSLAAPGATTAVPAFDPNFTDARLAVQMTIDRLALQPDRAQWADIVASSIMAVPSMLDYFRTVTVFGAMMDNGADEALAAEVCQAAAQIALQNNIPIR